MHYQTHNKSSSYCLVLGMFIQCNQLVIITINGPGVTPITKMKLCTSCSYPNHMGTKVTFSMTFEVALYCNYILSLIYLQ